ncbi:MAG: hypothetical protein ACJZ6B_07000 [Actinomycetes bacterium]
MRDFGQVDPAGFDLADVPSADIALYFPDGPPKLYQLTQWLPVFEGKNDVTTIVIVRQVDAFNALHGKTPLRVILVPRYEDLMALLDRANFGAVVYVNNGWTNFQALSFQRAVHIHVNHGESDKICMVSNQAKAYDKVFVAGQAAIERHEAALAWFDQSHLVRVGRPQLDLEVSPALPPTDRTTITYAPTWEGEDEANNYSSVDVYGVRIIQAMVDHPRSRIVYIKPTPPGGGFRRSGDPFPTPSHRRRCQPSGIRRSIRRPLRSRRRRHARGHSQYRRIDRGCFLGQPRLSVSQARSPARHHRPTHGSIRPSG